MRTGSRRHRISAAFHVPGRRADSLRIGLHANFLDIAQLGAHTGDGEGTVKILSQIDLAVLGPVLF